MRGEPALLPATQEEADEIKAYFQWQAPDLEIAFLQKIYSETILGHRHDVWDVHTNRDRWWVITNPTNLYSQEQFPNMDLAVTFHMGLCLRIPRTEQQLPDAGRLLPFGEVLNRLSETKVALSQAQNLGDYQAIGMRSREALLAFTSVAQEAAVWGGTELPKQADFKGWTDIIADALLSGSSQASRRHLLKCLMKEIWTFANWLTHSKSATWHDAEICLDTTEHTLGYATSLVVRAIRNVPDECPSCRSPDLTREEGHNLELPEIVWERPRCDSCGWTGMAVPIQTSGDDIGEIFVREGHDESAECVIPSDPLRGLKHPRDS